MSEASVALAGTVGEWVQGWILPDGEALVSLVVPWRGRVSVGEDLDDPLPAKAASALAVARRRLDRPGLGARIDNPLPVGKGLASSTVDVCGILAAASRLASPPWGEEEIFSLACSVEPSDGILFPGLALVDHLRGRLIERLPPPPPLSLLALIPPRSLDTEEYRRDPAFLKRVRDRAPEHLRAYSCLRRGLFEGDGALVARGATLSARTQNGLLPRPEWPLLEEGLRWPGALGIALAHSGTASALLFRDRPSADEARRRLVEGFSGSVVLFEPCGGGIAPFETPPEEGKGNVTGNGHLSRRCPL